VKKHEQGFEHYKKSNGEMSNAEIANHLGVSNSTVRKWKSRYKWNEKLGIKKNVTPSKKENVTKNIRDEQQQRIVDALVEAGTYSPALDLLIEVYLDAYEEYQQEKTEKLRKELARLLGQLGLDGKNKELIKKNGKLLAKGDEEKKEEKDPEPAQNNKLLQFRQRMQR
jgi:transposase